MIKSHLDPLIHCLNNFYEEAPGFQDNSRDFLYLKKIMLTPRCQCHRGVSYDTVESELFFIMTCGSF